MIRAKDITRLTEEYYERVKTDNGSVEVFVNPSSKELYEIGNAVRFIADANKKEIYVWYFNFLHQEVQSKLRLPKAGRPGIIWGEAEKENRIYRMTHSYEVSMKKVSAETLLKWDWTWADRHIEITPYLEQL